MKLPVRKQREIVRLHFHSPSKSNRFIARSTGVSAEPVKTIRRLLVDRSLDWQMLKDLDDDQWCRALGTEDKSRQPHRPAPDWQWIFAEMQRPSATLEQLWQEWREVNPNGVAYSQFTALYRQWRKEQHVVMRRTHVPGEKLFVDFAGQTVEIRDSKGGDSTFAQIFIAVMGHSNFTYVQAVASQTVADWVICHCNCFESLGGTPKWVVSDNLKSAVLRHGRDQVLINPEYDEMLRHYNTAALPAQPLKPKQKAKAEVGVQIAQRWMLFRLRDRVFFSLEELNAELRRLTIALNEHPFKKIAGCRRERFEAADKGALQSLPARPYELCVWRYEVRVGDDYHVEHLKCLYSVPFALTRERVDLRITTSMIEVFFKGRRVALHTLLKNAGDVSTVHEHRPIAHRRVLDGDPRALLKWAEGVGPHAKHMILHHVQERSDLANGIKAARRMRTLASEHGEARFEAVCAYALPLNITSLRSISSILMKDADLRAQQEPEAKPRPTHDNVRGPEYYGDES